MNISDKFENKLKQNNETIRIQNKQINESELRFRREADERQRVHQLYETELQNCRQMKDLLSKLETDSKIAIEKQSIESKEQNHLYLNQIQRLSEQINQLKHQINAIQTKDWHLEQKLVQKESKIQTQNSFRLIIDSELNQIKTKAQSLREEQKTLSENQIQLKSIVESSDGLIVELRAQFNQNNKQLIDSEKDNSALRTLVSDLREKCRQMENTLNDNELQSLRLTQRNDLQKQEINELRALLEESVREKTVLTKQFNQIRMNSSQSVECDVNTESPTLSSATSQQIPVIIE